MKCQNKMFSLDINVNQFYADSVRPLISIGKDSIQFKNINLIDEIHISIDRACL